MTKEKTTTKTIDITPSWTAILPALYLFIDSGTQKQKDYVKMELAKLAAAVDAMNAANKGGK